MMALLPLSLSMTLLAGPAAEAPPQPSAPPADEAWASPSPSAAPGAQLPNPEEVQERRFAKSFQNAGSSKLGSKRVSNVVGSFPAPLQKMAT